MPGPIEIAARVTHRRSHDRLRSILDCPLPSPLLRDKGDLQQVHYGRLERDRDAERQQVRDDEIAQVQDQLETQTDRACSGVSVVNRGTGASSLLANRGSMGEWDERGRRILRIRARVSRGIS